MAGYRGKQGRKPKPGTILERQRERGDVPLKRLPPAPAHLSETEKAEWKRVGRLLTGTGMITKLDTTILSAYCVAYAQWVDANSKVKQLGLIYKSPKGFLMQNPYLAIANKAQKQMTALLSELGMTPVSRARLPKSIQPRQGRELAQGDRSQDPRLVLVK